MWPWWRCKDICYRDIKSWPSNKKSSLISIWISIYQPRIVNLCEIQQRQSSKLIPSSLLSNNGIGMLNNEVVSGGGYDNDTSIQIMYNNNNNNPMNNNNNSLAIQGLIIIQWIIITLVNNIDEMHPTIILIPTSLTTMITINIL